jgi:ArsR family transcriptional regulator, arsenate/arsenite/antimonite-responsive transcriptional repressor
LSISTIIDYDAGMTRSLDPDVRLLAALADPVRLGILRELAGNPEVCACDFTECCNVSQPTVSHHLKVLRDAGVVVSERRGTWIYYRLAPDVLERLSAIARTFVPGGLIPLTSIDALRPATPEKAAVAPTQ